MYSTQSEQDLYRAHSALVDLTNSLAETTNGHFEQKSYVYTTSCGDGRQQQQQQHYSPAPYPPLPPAAPTAPQAVCLPLPTAPTLPELVAHYTSPVAAAQEHQQQQQQSPPPPPPPPPAPPLRWPSSCYNFSTPPAPAAPYPPLPRAGAVSPTSLNVEYAQHCPAAVDTPLPAPGALFADVPHDGQGRSVSPPPPPPPPPFPPQPPSNDNWAPSPPPPQWWQAPSNLPAQPVTRQFRQPAAVEGVSANHKPKVVAVVGSSHVGGDAGSNKSSSSSRSGNSSGRASCHKRSGSSSAKSSAKSRVNGDNAAKTSRDDGYVIPQKSSVSSRTSRDDGYVIPKKGNRSGTQDHHYHEDRYERQRRPNHPGNRESSPDRKNSPHGSSNSSRDNRHGYDDDDFRRPSASSSSSSNRGNHGVRWPRKGDGHYYRDSNGGDRDRDHDKHQHRRAQDDNTVGGRYGGGGGRYQSGGRGEERERESGGYRRGNSRDNEDGASPGSDEGRGRRGEGRGEGAGARRKRGSGKSCPPPRAEQRQDARAGALVVEEAVLSSSEKKEDGDDELAELTSKLTALELDARKAGVGVGVGVGEESAGKGGAAGGAGKAYLSLEEYKEATAAGEMQPYKGTKYQTVDDRYADGWAYNANTRRWIKVACQQKKDAIDALPALLAKLELMENKDKLATQRSQLLETKVEKISKEKKTTERSTVSLAVPTAPALVVFDTNWLIHNLPDTMCRVRDIAGRHKDTSVLIPKEVLRELDRLKTRGKNEGTRSSAQKANRYFRGLVESPLERGREFPVVRVQEDTELFRDKGHHARPEGLGGDDSILNCCMFFTQGIDAPRKVTLVTGDNNFAIRGSAHGLTTTGRPQCDPGRCRMPLCPAPPRPSPFSRGF